MQRKVFAVYNIFFNFMIFFNVKKNKKFKLTNFLEGIFNFFT